MNQRVLNILLAEDNEGDILLVELALNQEGLLFNLVSLTEGEAVLKYLDSLDQSANGTQSPDLVIVDLNLPRHSGAEILLRLQKSPKWCHVPRIVMTSSNSPKDRQNAALLGVAEYFRKATDLDEFLTLGRVVRRVLDGLAHDATTVG